jgi:hypothetical protein
MTRRPFASRNSVNLIGGSPPPFICPAPADAPPAGFGVDCVALFCADAGTLDVTSETASTNAAKQFLLNIWDSFLKVSGGVPSGVWGYAGLACTTRRK